MSLSLVFMTMVLNDAQFFLSDLNHQQKNTALVTASSGLLTLVSQTSQAGSPQDEAYGNNGQETILGTQAANGSTARHDGCYDEMIKSQLHISNFIQGSKNFRCPNFPFHSAKGFGSIHSNASSCEAFEG